MSVGPDWDRVIRAGLHSALTSVELAMQAADIRAGQQRDVGACLHYTRIAAALQDAMVALHRADAGVCVTLLPGETGGADRVDR